MDLNQNDLEYLSDMVNTGRMSSEQANVEMVRLQRVFIVSKLPVGVRRVLNEAVKCGRLKHNKKDGLKPECYFHPDFEHLAKAEIAAIVERSLKSIKQVLA